MSIILQSYQKTNGKILYILTINNYINIFYTYALDAN